MKPFRSFAVALILGLLGGCNLVKDTLVDPSPSSSPSPTPTSSPVLVPAPPPIIVPVIGLPTPAPTPSATPKPSPTPAPAPEPTPPPSDPNDPSGGPVTVYCSPWIAPDGYSCPKSPNPRFVGVVEKAILDYKNDHPNQFKDYLVLNPNKYYNGVFQYLYQAGYCAIEDGEEVAVAARGDQNYRENYKIITSTGKYWTGLGSHQSACQRR
jgi:hypothetical protein